MTLVSGAITVDMITLNHNNFLSNIFSGAVQKMLSKNKSFIKTYKQNEIKNKIR